jgi:F0F1-type ATP synthase membrane subunit b/b'
MNTGFYEQLAMWSQVAGALAFMGCIVYLWFKVVTPAVIAGRDKKNAELVEAEQRRDRLKLEAEAAQAELARADADVAAIAERARRDSARLAERILADANTEGERVVRNAEGELGRSRLAAHDTLRDELLSKALQIARESAKSLDASADRRLVDQTIGALESEPA